MTVNELNLRINALDREVLALESRIKGILDKIEALREHLGRIQHNQEANDYEIRSRLFDLEHKP